MKKKLLIIILISLFSLGFVLAAPTINFELPTPSNTSSTSSPVTIVANISDTGNTSSWIDFDRTLIGYWAMDYHNSTVIFDNSTYTNNATIAGGFNASNLITGKRGNALDFHNTSNSLTVPRTSSLNLTQYVSISLWAKANNTDIYDDLFTQTYGYGYDLMLINDVSRFVIFNSTGGKLDCYAGTNLRNNAWHHLVSIFNGTTMITYVDGVQATPCYVGPNTIYPQTASVGYQIGGSYWGASTSFNGSLDEVMLFNKSLSSTEVKALYSSQINKFNTSAMPLANGQHNYTVYAINESGNINNSGWRYFTVSSGTVGSDLCGVLPTAGTTYTLTDNVSSTGTCFTVTAANITINCNNNWITYSTGGGALSYGVYSNQTNTTIKNCNILDGNWTSTDNNRQGIYFIDASNRSTIFKNFINTSNSNAIFFSDTDDLFDHGFHNVSSNRIVTNSTNTIYITIASENILFNNTVTSLGTERAILIEASLRNNLTNNTAISNSGASLWFNEVSNTTVRNNNFTSTSGRGIYTINNAYNNVFINNTVRSWSSESALEIASGSDNVSLINNTAICNSAGNAIVVSYSNYATLIGNNATNYGSGQGIYINSYLNVNLTSNYVSSNSLYAIALSDSNSSFLMNNTVRSVSSRAISLMRSDNNTLRNNNASTSGVGIYLRYSDNNTLINNNGGSSGNRAFQIDESFNNTLTNNTGTSSANDGLLLYKSNNTILTNNTFTTSSGSAYGVYLWTASTNNTFINNTIYSGLIGIYIQDSSNNNTFMNNTATSPGYAIFIQSSSNNSFTNQIARATGASGYGVYLFGAGNNLFRDCVNVSGLSYDVYYGNSAGNVNNTFINCSYASTNSSKEYVQGAGSQLIRKWYYKAYANYSNGTYASGANITAYNVSNKIQFTENTNGSGWIQRQEVIEYNNTGGTRIYYNNYTINANKSGTSNDTNIFNFTTQQNKINDFFTLTGGAGSTACGDLNSAGTTYTLTDNVSSTGTCFTVTAQNVTLNCNGYWITYSTGGGASTRGVVTDQFNTTIKNCNIVDGNWTSSDTSRYGIYFNTNDNSTIFRNFINTSNGYAVFVYNYANFNNLTNNRIISNSSFGIAIQTYSNNSILINNTVISNTSAAISFSTSSKSLITNNTATSGGAAGIELSSSSNNNTLTNNNVTSVSNVGIGISTSFNNTLTNNTGRSLGNLYGLSLVSANNNFLTNNTFTSNSSYGIYLQSSSNNTLTNNNATSNSSIGIYIYWYSENNTLTNNKGTSNTNAGIWIASYSNNNTLINNTGTSNLSIAILISSSDNNNLTNNNGTSTSETGIMLNSASNNSLLNNTGRSYGAGYAIYLLSSSNNILINNTGISNTSTGIYLYSASNNNTLTKNIGISNTSNGIHLLLVSNNTLINNTATSTSGNGIYFESSSNNTLTGNNVTSNISNGIYLSSSSNNNLINNNGTSNNNRGIYLLSSSNNTLINNTGTSTSQRGVDIQSSSNNTFTNQIAITTGTSGTRYGIYISGSNNTIFRDCINVSGGTWDIVYTSTVGSINNTFINCSYNTAKEIVQGAGNELIRKWYYQAYVNYSNSTAASGANISAFNVSSSLEFTDLTAGTGWINRQEVTEYVNRVGTRTYYNNYSIAPTKTGYYAATHTFNFTITQNKINDWFTLYNTSCVYLSGNWSINCSENCAISTNYNVGGNNISIIGFGTVIVSANITNYQNLHIAGQDSTNICRVRCVGGGCFKN